jgi:hypothetical protein
MIADESLITELTATIYNAMNEQLTQAYLNLINQLLTCNEGDEPQILQENQRLLDRGLIEIMIAVAQQYREAGRENEA